MAEHDFWQRQVGGHQERRPIDRMKSHDVLADDMQIGRPPFTIDATGTGQIIGQRVDPDVHHMAGTARHRYTPIETSARHRQVFQTTVNKSAHLIEPT